MTDRHNGYIVALNREIREDDAEWVINAIRMIKGVASVTPMVSDANSAIEQMRAQDEIRTKLYGFIKENLS